MSDLVLRIEHGDCLVKMQEMIDEGVQVDSIVTDTPYHLTSIVKRFGRDGSAPVKTGATGAFARASRGFMGKKWDGGDVAFRAETWRLALALLKPGGHLVAFGGSRTYGRLQLAIEEAGFEVRDGLLQAISEDEPVRRFMDSLSAAQVDAFMRCIEESQFGGLLAWVYGSGMPKSHDQAKMIDKKLGKKGTFGAPKSAAHAGWIARGRMRGEDGHEGYQRPWMQDEEAVARNARQYLPATEEAQRWQGWGTALKPAFEPIILARKPLCGTVPENLMRHGVGALNINACRVACDTDGDNGRWPSNFTHDGSADVLDGFPVTPGAKGGVNPDSGSKTGGVIFERFAANNLSFPRGDVGSAARFHYSAKAGVDDRLGTDHPTVKTVDTMRWLVRLVTPKGGVVLDPFAGSGTTGHAAAIEGIGCILIEMEEQSVADCRRRLAFVRGEGRHSALEKARLSDPAKARKARGGDTPLFDDGTTE